MNFRTMPAMTLLTASLITGLAPAQGLGGLPGPFGGGGWFLATNEGILRELKVNDDQAQELEGLVNGAREKFRRMMTGELAALPAEKRRGRMQELAHESNEDLREGLARILKPEQHRRFDEIALQASGLEAFAIDRVRVALKLTGTQDKAIRDINLELQDSLAGLRDEAQKDRDAVLKGVTRLRRESVAKTVGLMTDDQKATWKGLVGEPYDVVFKPPGRPQ